jgi:hypothetical protein
MDRSDANVCPGVGAATPLMIGVGVSFRNFDGRQSGMVVLGRTACILPTTAARRRKMPALSLPQDVQRAAPCF